MTTQVALAGAARMGARRGAAFHNTGIPCPCPFVGDQLADLAAAWSRAYLEAVAPQVLTPASD